MLTLACTRSAARPAASVRPAAPAAARRAAVAAPAPARRATVTAAVAALPTEAELMAPAPTPKSGEKVRRRGKLGACLTLRAEGLGRV
jgi:hypothetical protein